MRDLKITKLSDEFGRYVIYLRCECGHIRRCCPHALTAFRVTLRSTLATWFLDNAPSSAWRPPSDERMYETHGRICPATTQRRRPGAE
jgi:hypothetical protein